MNPMPARPGAVVVATNADNPTQFAYAAAERVAELIRADGRFEPIEFLPHDPATNLSAEFTCHRFERELRLAYFSAHGAAEKQDDNTYTGRGLTDRVGSDRLFLACRPSDTYHSDGVLFTSAVLIVNACLCDGRLPDLLVRQPAQVRAVIGYRHDLQVGTDAQLRRWLGSRYDEYREHFIAALVQPIRSLLKGRSAQEARDDTFRLWCDLADAIRRWRASDASVDRLVLNIVVNNGFCLHLHFPQLPVSERLTVGG